MTQARGALRSILLPDGSDDGDDDDDDGGGAVAAAPPRSADERAPAPRVKCVGGALGARARRGRSTGRRVVRARELLTGRSRRGRQVFGVVGGRLKNAIERLDHNREAR